jgi:hypothetical protein
LAEIREGIDRLAQAITESMSERRTMRERNIPMRPIV